MKPKRPNRLSRRRPRFWSQRGSAARGELHLVLDEIESKAKASGRHIWPGSASLSAVRHRAKVDTSEAADA